MPSAGGAEGFFVTSGMMAMVYASKRKILRGGAYTGMIALAVAVIVAAAAACYPLPWRTMQDGAEVEFSGSVQIDLNSATLEQLCLLPGVGPEKAAAIIQYRETYAYFSSLEEVMEVRGIGEATVESWQGMAVVR